MGSLAQPAFIDEDDGAPLAERFFLSRGQRLASSTESPPRRAPASVRWAAGSSTRAGADARNVGFVIAHPALVLDQRTHPARGPQPAGVAERLGTASERLLDLPQLAGAQLGLRPARPACFNPARPDCASCAPSESPIADGRPSAALPHLAYALLGQPRGFHPPPFQSPKFRRTPSCIPHSSKLSYDIDIMQESIIERSPMVGGIWINLGRFRARPYAEKRPFTSPELFGGGSRLYWGEAHKVKERLLPGLLSRSRAVVRHEVDVASDYFDRNRRSTSSTQKPRWSTAFTIRLKQARCRRLARKTDKIVIAVGKTRADTGFRTSWFFATNSMCSRVAMIFLTLDELPEVVHDNRRGRVSRRLRWKQGWLAVCHAFKVGLKKPRSCFPTASRPSRRSHLSARPRKLTH